MELQNYCLIKDDGIDLITCNQLIKLFDTNQQHHQRYDQDKKPNFTQFNFTSNKHINTNLHDNISKYALGAVEEYKSRVKDTQYWPSTYGFEQFRIKHYNNDSVDQFDTHVDAIDVPSSKRFLAFFWYLNDVDQGGETEFTNFDLIIKPKKGRLFMFPPLWTYPHKGNPPISNNKYLLSSYLHFNK